MTDNVDMDKYKDVLVGAAEFIRDRLYFVTLRTQDRPKSTPCTHYFSIDRELCYQSFYYDFGPLNLSMLYHYCTKLNKKLKASSLQNKTIVHYTTSDSEKRLNSAYLIASYAVLYLDYTPQKAYDTLQTNNSQPYAAFRDASAGFAYHISVLDCLNALYKAHNYGFFNFDSFDYLEYEHYERVDNGDLNWILPGKFIGFCGPHNKSLVYNGYPLHSPETYFNYFRRHNVTTIIRLNKKIYDSNKFVNGGFDHKDLYFEDGSIPTDRIMNQFIDICEKAKGAVAVHCKAGLGRTGTLIGCYLMKHYKFTAHEAIAWIRICRPGSIIGHQQEWLESKQIQMWRVGEQYRLKRGLNGPIEHTEGIYSITTKVDCMKNSMSKRLSNDNVSGILEKVDTMNINDRDDKKVTQGDKLNQIKAQRTRSKALGIPLTDERLRYGARVVVTPRDSASLIRSAKLSVRASSVSNTKAFAKRNETVESSRRTSHRKLTTTTPAILSNGRPRLSEGILTRLPKRKENCTWPVEDFTKSNGNIESSNRKTEEEVKLYSIKRGKRTLNTEKFSSPRSVKVLRRSQAQNSTAVPGKATSKIQLPIVKITK